MFKNLVGCKIKIILNYFAFQIQKLFAFSIILIPPVPIKCLQIFNEKSYLM